MVRRWHLVRCVHACPVCSQAVSGAAQCVTSQLLCYWCIYIFLIYWTRWTLHFLGHPFPVQSSQREKNITFKHLFEWRLAKLGERESSEGNPWCSALVADATKIYFALSPPPSTTNLLPVSLPVEVRGGCKKFQLRLSHLAAVQNSIACFQKPVCLPAGWVWKGHTTLRPCLGEQERESERERWGKATRHGSALPTLPYLAEQLFSG